jgi:hypothetical protein
MGGLDLTFSCGAPVFSSPEQGRQVPETLSCWASRRGDFPMFVLRLDLSTRTGETPKGHRLNRFCSFSSSPWQKHFTGIAALCLVMRYSFIEQENNLRLLAGPLNAKKLFFVHPKFASYILGE